MSMVTIPCESEALPCRFADVLADFIQLCGVWSKADVIVISGIQQTSQLP